VTNHCDRRITPSDTDKSLLCSIYTYFTPYFDVAFYSNTPIAKKRKTKKENNLSEQKIHPNHQDE
jgi:hypothetical protein